MKRNLLKINKTEDKEKIVYLFRYFQKEYPGIFGDLNFHFVNDGRMCVNPIKEYICIDMNEMMYLINYDESSRYIFNTSIEELQQYNKNISLAEFILLHELGHYLDYIDNPEKYTNNAEDKMDTMNYINYECFRMSNFLSDSIYTKTKIERRATLNAFKMAKVLADRE